MRLTTPACPGFFYGKKRLYALFIDSLISSEQVKQARLP